MITVEPIRDRQKIKEIEAVLRDREDSKGMAMYLLFEVGIYLARRVSDMANITATAQGG